nr:MFS transporter [Pseudomonas fuscovaginae]
MKLAQSLPPTRTQTGITFTLALSMLLTSLGTSIANIALPTLAEVFSAPFAQVQSVVVAYLATLTISVVIAGRLGDRHGLKPMLMVGLTVFGIASVLCGVAPNLWLLIGARALQGIGAAFLMTLAMALMRQTASEARMGRAMGLLGTVSALGTALGPSFGGLLIEVAGWRGIFWVQFPLAGIALTLAAVTLPGGTGRGATPSASVWSVLGWRLMPNLLVNGLVAAVMMTTLVVGPFYLGFGLGLKAAQVGFVMAIGPVISIFSGVPSGRLVDAWGNGRARVVGLILLAAGAFMLTFLPDMIGVAGYLISLIILTPGYQLFQAANNTTTLADVPKDRHGTVSGLLSLSRNVGLIAGASVMGTVFSFGVGTQAFAQASASAIASGMRLTFMLAGVMMICSIMITVGRAFRRS